MQSKYIIFNHHTCHISQTKRRIWFPFQKRVLRVSLSHITYSCVRCYSFTFFHFAFSYYFKQNLFHPTIFCFLPRSLLNSFSSHSTSVPYMCYLVYSLRFLLPFHKTLIKFHFLVFWCSLNYFFIFFRSPLSSLQFLLISSFCFILIFPSFFFISPFLLFLLIIYFHF